MFIDYDRGRLLVSTDSGEDVVRLSETSKFRIVSSYDNITGSYIMPFAALPIIKMSCKSLKYKLDYSEAFKCVYLKFIKKRKKLEGIKKGILPDDELTKDIQHFLDEYERIYGFKYYQLQRDSIIYGIHGERCCIGNDIGTGKTLTVVSIIKYLISKGLVKKCIILVPASLVRNFHDDYIRFFGRPGMISVRDESKEMRIRMYTNFKHNDNFNFLVTNYEKCLFDIDELKNLTCDAVVVDEFHKMRNFISAKRSINFFDTISNIWKPKYKYPMSGTPIENRLFDLYPVFKFVDSGFSVGGQQFFDENFVEYEKKTFRCKGKGGHGHFLRTERVAVGFKNHEYLKDLVRPMIIRKKLELDVGLVHKVIEIDMTKKIKEKYEELISETKSAPSLKYHATRQALCDVKRINLEDSDNPKLDIVRDIVEQTQDKVLIFSFYKCSIRCLESYLNSIGITTMKITGDDKLDPVEVVNQFSSSDTKVLLATDKIQYGVNIQCAKVVINYELPLKPSTSQQRIGRSYRTGQTSDVLAISLVMKNSVEEIIYEQFKTKEHVITTMIENLDTIGHIDSEFISDISSKLKKHLNIAGDFDYEKLYEKYD